MEYPKEFSAAAQNNVEAEKILADKEFNNEREHVQPHHLKSDSELNALIRHWVTRVVLAFAKEACSIGQLGVWNASEIDYSVHSFLGALASEADREKRFHRDGSMVRGNGLTYGHRQIYPEEMYRLKASPEWKDCEALRLKVAQQRGGSAESKPSEVVTKIREKRRNEAYKESPALSNRARWLRDRLVERGWNRNDPLRQGGPDPKSIDKILGGRDVREDVLEKLGILGL